MPARDIQKRLNRDEEQKPGRPPRSAYEPPGSEGSVRTPKTATDPVSGETQPGPRPPDRAEADQTRKRR